ncbi:MAG: hypothetical protein D6748_04875 [Calditrichaeota bacterium]|nr:MAG: hypothetical protein D6748_04875 [Calditrichota bacterium]
MKHLEKLFGHILLYVVLLLSSQLFGQRGGGNQSSWKSNVGILYTDPSNTFVGIGVQNPTAPLEINAIGLKLFLNQGVNSTPSYMKFKVKSSSASWTMGLSTGNDFMIGVSDDLTDSKFTIMSSTGNIGIGTSTPASKLSVNGDIDISGSRLHVGTDGNIGIGTTAPTEPLHIYKSGTSGVTTLKLEYDYTGDPNGHQDADWRLQAASSGGKFHIASGTQTRLTIDGAGNVGIGTTSPSPSYKLSVLGKIRAEEIVVETGWSDFVFEDDYRLMPLKEVEQHIKAHKHLPGIPSADEVAANGVSVGEMQAKLLQKVEELTLYVIEQNKAINQLQQENIELRKEINLMKSER